MFHAFMITFGIILGLGAGAAVIVGLALLIATVADWIEDHRNTFVYLPESNSVVCTTKARADGLIAAGNGRRVQSWSDFGKDV